MGCMTDPNANTRHTENFDCVVTPNVRQRLVERDVLCIVVGVRLRTKNAQMNSAVRRKRLPETAMMYVAMNQTVWESLERFGGLSDVEYTWR